MESEDFYRILQVDPWAEPQVIAAAYRQLAQKYHPDVDASIGATRRMQQINRAYRVLSQAELRQAYDRARQAGASTGPGPPVQLDRLGAAAPASGHPPAREPRKLRARGVVVLGLVLLGLLVAGGTAYAMLRPRLAAGTPAVRTVWKGEWVAQDGDVYSCRIKLRTNARYVVSGSVVWTLKESPGGSRRHLVGRKATAYIKGTLDPASQVIQVGSYKSDDPYGILEVTEYQFASTGDGHALQGELYHAGVRQGALMATRVE